ncbi:MAG: capsular biosynthesis protein [Pseudomonadota bacterium]
MGSTFLFLQGPHGPFFHDLALAVRASGASVLKAGVSKADDSEWGNAGPYQGYTGRPEGWSEWLQELIAERAVTDLVLYGDTRFYHRAAIEIAQSQKITIHCFEEGYLRPYWITYERGGTNGHSRVMDFSVPMMAEASRIVDYDLLSAPPVWGNAWRHAFHGFRHHADVMFFNKAYPHFQPHRPTDAWREFVLYLKRLMVLPMLVPERRLRERQLLKSGKLYHLVLLQMAIDASMRDHSTYSSVLDFVDDCLTAFAEGAPKDHHIVFKAHPFEDGRERLETRTKYLAKSLGIADRVVFLQGGKLGPLLDRARSAITINSTAGQQALWRGLPLSVHGASVYAKPEFTERRDLAAFFRRPTPPDAVAYREYRQFLLMTSQLRGSFYSASGRRAIVPAATAKMLDSVDPYDRLIATAANLRDQIAAEPNIAVFPGDRRGGRLGA